MQIGDKIMVIDDDLSGVISKIENSEVHFVTDEGFNYVYHLSKIVVVDSLIENLLLQGNPRKKRLSQKAILKKNKSKKMPVFDLHIEKIQVRHKHLSDGQKLQIQLDEVHRIIIKMQRQKQKEFILVHGVGKGVLKNEIIKILKTRKITFSDASYLHFGQNAALRVSFMVD